MSLATRPADAAVALQVNAAPAGRRGEIPNIDLAGSWRERGGERSTPPAVKRVIQKATPMLRRCYAQARALDAGLSGRIVVKLTIDRKGAVTAVSFLETDMTEGLSRCARQALTTLKLKRGQGPLEVVVPWTFSAR